MSRRKQPGNAIADAARRLMFILDGINPRFPLAPGKVAEIEEAKDDLRAALDPTSESALNDKVTT